MMLAIFRHQSNNQTMLQTTAYILSNQKRLYMIMNLEFSSHCNFTLFYFYLIFIKLFAQCNSSTKYCFTWGSATENNNNLLKQQCYVIAQRQTQKDTCRIKNQHRHI